MKNSFLFSVALLLASAAVFAATAESGTRVGPMPGQIIIDPENPRWLKRHGGAHLFICGPGDPEEFLYRGTRNPDGTRAGDQVALIRKLSEHGGNSIYMQAVRTHGGDAKPDTTHNPFVDSDPAKGLDERILAQWEQWFTLMDENGILIYFFFYDDSARIWNTGDQVSAEERAFVAGIVRRFKHHKNLIWIVGEEVEERYTGGRVNALAGIIRQSDEHGHIVGAHHLSGTTFKHWKAGGALSHFSMQLSAKEDAAHAGALDALRKAEGRYQIIYSESTAMPVDGEGMRRHAWSVAMGGLMPMLLRMDIAGTSTDTLRQCRILQRFFEATDFPTMTPHDALKHAETKYVLADPGRSYIAYADKLSSELGLKAVPGGNCLVTWLDCITGQSLTEQHQLSASGDRIFRKPAQLGNECAAWIRFPDVQRGQTLAPARSALTAQTAPRQNQPPVVLDRRVNTVSGVETYIQLQFQDPDGPGPYTYTIVNGPAHGSLTGADNDRTYTGRPGFVGTDRFTWKVSDGQSESRIGTVIINVTHQAGK